MRLRCDGWRRAWERSTSRTRPTRSRSSSNRCLSDCSTASSSSAASADRTSESPRASAERKEDGADARRDRPHAPSVRRGEVIAARTAEQRGRRPATGLVADALAAARSNKQSTLAGIREDRAEFIAEVVALQRESAALAARSAARRPAQAVRPARGASSSGLIWPVHGPVTSGFGWRWGQMHEGIDIAVPSGTPVVASGAGP